MPVLRLIAALLIVAALNGLAAFPAAAGLRIEIDKQAQRMSVSVDGVSRYSWPVSTGRAGRQTPEGTFTPFRLEEDHYSKEWDDAPMPHSIFFTRAGHAIHGSYDVKKLGTPASAGCVRLHPDNAAKLFALVKEAGLNNTKVVISGDEPVIARERGERRRAAAPRTAPERVRTWPPAQAERDALDAYAARMRRRYYLEYPQPAPVQRRPYYIVPQYQAAPRYYVVPRRGYDYGWD